METFWSKSKTLIRSPKDLRIGVASNFRSSLSYQAWVRYSRRIERSHLRSATWKQEGDVLNTQQTRRITLPFVVTNPNEADRLGKSGHIKIGILCFPIIRRVMIIRCHQCLEYGHIGWNFDEEVRSTVYFKCREVDHKFGNCKKSPSFIVEISD